MKRSAAMLVFLVGIVWSSSTALRLFSAEPQTKGDIRVVLLEFSGRVEVAEAGSDKWLAAITNQVLNPGARLRTGKHSRAILRPTPLTTIPLGPESLLQIHPQENTISFLRGILYFFHRDKPGHIQIRTPTAYAVIRGTEFNLVVAPDESTTLTLIDGQVDVSNPLGSLRLQNGQSAHVQPGQPPRPAVLEAINVIQWNLYYPGIVDLRDLGLKETPPEGLQPSIAAYESGDLLQALTRYPAADAPLAAPDVKAYHAAVLLAAGEVETATRVLNELSAADLQGPIRRVAQALRRLIAVVKGDQDDPARISPLTPELATEWLAASYDLQAQGRLPEALAAARAAVARSPDFAFALERMAELEWSFGRLDPALEALNRSQSLAPRNAQAHALRGFLLAARHRFEQAEEAFQTAIHLEPHLGNAWLGRGLLDISRGDITAGKEDLQVAATVEPRRAVLRAYLGKVFAHSADPDRARAELNLARRLDPADPTAYLYSALLDQQENRVNDAVRDVERSLELNENRRLYRSTLLLDQDRAVRSANLASIYQDAGLTDLSVREAHTAVHADYANYSAHLFLANSYDALRDPRQVNLRYETPWMSEYLLANLLAPAAAGVLSPSISQGEYGRLFERNRFGLSSQTEYYSRGDWIQTGSQFGQFDGTAYALDVSYRSENGYRVNNDLEQRTLTARVKQELSARDSVFLQVVDYDAEAGDVNLYYDEGFANPGLRLHERQQPIFFAGYHREWNPGIHTLALAGRLSDSFDVDNPAQGTLLFARDAANAIAGVRPVTLGQEYTSELEIYTGELQQIWELEKHTLILGGRVQHGEIEAKNLHRNANFAPALFAYDESEVSADHRRAALYAYDHWQLHPRLLLVGGLAYDCAEFPANFRYAPLADETQSEDLIAPKAGLIWSPALGTTVRAGYGRSLSGTSLDQSFQLEPTQVAGFNQSFRSLIPESVAGANAGAVFDSAGVGLEQKFARNTYLTVGGEWLASEVDRDVGIYNFAPPLAITPSQTREELDFQERALAVSLHQLVGGEWAFGARYRLAYATLDDRFPEISGNAAVFGGANPHGDYSALLHRVDLLLLYQHACGFFGQGHAAWHGQANHGYGGALPGDDFWQFDVWGGYRFWRRRIELAAGVVNVTDQDYHLNPLNWAADLPHDRAFALRLKLFF